MNEAKQTTIEPELARELAKFEIGSISEMRKALLDEHAASYRWLIASLLAVNGACALGLFGSTAVNVETKIHAGAAFFLGTFLSLLSAYFSQGAAKRVTTPLIALAGFWVAVSHNGEFDATVYKRLQDDLQAASTAGLPTRIAGWLSAICFCVGVFWTGYSLAHSPSANYPTPTPIEHYQAPITSAAKTAVTAKP